MSRKGNCWNNVVSENFFYSLKTELIYHEDFKTKDQTNEMIFGYIEIFYKLIFYNRKRLHSYNNYLLPAEFEEKMLHLEIVAWIITGPLEIYLSDLVLTYQFFN